MSKKLIAALMSATVVLSGLAGYAGSMAAGTVKGNSQVAQTLTTAGKTTGESNAGTKAGNETTTVPGFSADTAAVKASGNELSIEEIARINENSVVEIVTEAAVKDARFGQFISEGAGSGVIMTNDGYIITNNHVVDGATKVTIRLKDGTSHEAEIIGKDSVSDIAVVKIEAVNLIPATPGQSSALVVGETAVAIGNPLGELGGTVTEGIISALDREINIDGQTMRLLQTSAAINPGNSGGGLFDKYGKLVGIVNAKSSGSNIEGLGFAIPIDTATQIASDLIAHGYVKGRKSLGITIVNIATEEEALMYRVGKPGVYIQSTTKLNGLKAGDRFVTMNGETITEAAQIKRIMDSLKVGDTVEIVLERNGASTTVSILLEEDKN